MSYQFYMVLHLVAVVAVFISLGGVVSHSMAGGTAQNLKNRKGLAVLHGISLFLVFLAGFGLMAKAHFSFGANPWLFVKLFCWLLLGVFPILVHKRLLPSWAGVAGLIAIAATATYVVINKPL